MNELKVLENELVPVYETGAGERIVYGTELHAVLEVKTPYRMWIDRRVEECDAVENVDYEAAQICSPSGQMQKEHIIKLNTAKEMAMLERNDKGKQVRRYFIAVEEKYKDAIMPKDFPSALRAYADEYERRMIAEKERAELQEKLDESKDWYSIKRVAALNGVSWKTFKWRRLKELGEQMGYEVRKIFDSNYGEVNIYHRDVWEKAYPEYEL